jgi:hypothetical protein
MTGDFVAFHVASSEQTAKMSTTETRKLTDGGSGSDLLAGAAASPDFGLFRTQTYLLRRQWDRSRTKRHQTIPTNVFSGVGRRFIPRSDGRAYDATICLLLSRSSETDFVRVPQAH